MAAIRDPHWRLACAPAAPDCPFSQAKLLGEPPEVLVTLSQKRGAQIQCLNSMSRNLLGDQRTCIYWSRPAVFRVGRFYPESALFGMSRLCIFQCHEESPLVDVKCRRCFNRDRIARRRGNIVPAPGNRAPASAIARRRRLRESPVRWLGDPDGEAVSA